MKNQGMVSGCSSRRAKRTRTGDENVWHSRSPRQLMPDFKNSANPERRLFLPGMCDHLRPLSSPAKVRENVSRIVFMGDRDSDAKCADDSRASLTSWKPYDVQNNAICPSGNYDDLVFLDLAVSFLHESAARDKILDDSMDPSYEIFFNSKKKNARARKEPREETKPKVPPICSETVEIDFLKEFQTKKFALSEILDPGYHKYLTRLIEECEQAMEVGKNLINKLDEVSPLPPQEVTDLRGGMIHLENDRSNDSDDDVVVLNTHPSLAFNYGSSITVDEDEEDTQLDCFYVGNTKSYHQEKLSECLNQPYDENELNSHLELFRNKTSMEGCRQLRKGYKTFKLEAEGKSFEDHYSELGFIIRSTANKFVKLSLLRSFFYWLKHVGGGLLNPPWKDPFWLKYIQFLSERDDKDKPLRFAS